MPCAVLLFFLTGLSFEIKRIIIAFWAFVKREIENILRKFWGGERRIATGAVRPRNDIVFTRGAVRQRDTGVPPYNHFCRAGPVCPAGSAKKTRSGRCGERTERCRWQRKRSERVAAVKILSVRRKAAQKFWAPQQDHRPLRKRNKRCNGRTTARVAPTKALQGVR